MRNIRIRRRYLIIAIAIAVIGALIWLGLADDGVLPPPRLLLPVVVGGEAGVIDETGAFVLQLGLGDILLRSPPIPVNTKLGWEWKHLAIASTQNEGPIWDNYDSTGAYGWKLFGVDSQLAIRVNPANGLQYNRRWPFIQRATEEGQVIYDSSGYWRDLSDVYLVTEDRLIRQPIPFVSEGVAGDHYVAALDAPILLDAEGKVCGKLPTGDGTFRVLDRYVIVDSADGSWQSLYDNRAQQVWSGRANSIFPVLKTVGPPLANENRIRDIFIGISDSRDLVILNAQSGKRIVLARNLSEVEVGNIEPVGIIHMSVTWFAERGAGESYDRWIIHSGVDRLMVKRQGLETSRVSLYSLDLEQIPLPISEIGSDTEVTMIFSSGVSLIQTDKESLQVFSADGDYIREIQTATLGRWRNSLRERGIDWLVVQVRSEAGEPQYGIVGADGQWLAAPMEHDIWPLESQNRNTWTFVSPFRVRSRETERKTGLLGSTEWIVDQVLPVDNADYFLPDTTGLDQAFAAFVWEKQIQVVDAQGKTIGTLPGTRIVPAAADCPWVITWSRLSNESRREYRFHMLDLRTGEVFPEAFATITPLARGIIYVYTTDGRHGYLRADGSWLWEPTK